ncbi:dispersed gene family protein 1 (DGF-1), partial [Trypanosoma grayi]|uniref:dispersed gene family protein 1 (DGF-1) n=1 Tax=Trypanosoma grayi TaxID=71804 RepID=UPI0004F41EB6
GDAGVCFDGVVLSGPITVVVDLSAMDAFADALNVTLRHCLLAGGALLRIRGVDEGAAGLLPRVLLSMTNVTVEEGTVVLQGALPSDSIVLLANSTMRATSSDSQYVPTTPGEESFKYGPALVLDGVRLLRTQFVVTRTSLTCEGTTCSAILVEHGLNMNQSSTFYMDNCVVKSSMYVMNFISSDLGVGGGSVFSVQNSSWRSSGTTYTAAAWLCRNVVVNGGSVLQFMSSVFRVNFILFSADTLTVDDGSWLLYRDNEFRAYYVMYVPDESRVWFRNQSAWSILRNSFLPGTFSSFYAYLVNYWYSPVLSSSTVYGACNTVMGTDVTDYGLNLELHVEVTSLDCGECAQSAECYAARTSGISGCKCECAPGGHGDLCLPAAVPDGLGPLPVSNDTDKNNTEVPCVYGGSLSSVSYPDSGVLGLCFVDVTFTAPITIDAHLFDAPQQIINITLLRCFLSGMAITAGGERVYVNVSSSSLETSYVQIMGSFGENSQILFVDNVFLTAIIYGLYIQCTLGVNSTMLLLRNRIAASSSAVYFSTPVVLDGSGIIIQESTLMTEGKDFYAYSAVYINSLSAMNGGYLSIENCTMDAATGVIIMSGGTVASRGLLSVANSTFVGSTEVPTTALVLLYDDMIFSGGAQWRVVNNNVRSASIFYLMGNYTMSLADSGTTVVLAHNRQEGSAPPFAQVTTSTTTVAPPAQFVVGCNMQDGTEIAYDGVFLNVTEFVCGTCNNDAACYMPKTSSVASGTCSCTCEDGGHGPQCLPFEVPDVALLPTPERPVDTDTSCVADQTLTTLSLNMWKTHHCYVGVTFSGTGAVATFRFVQMPLQHPINITFSGCTFLGGAALHFVGGSTAAENSGVLVRVSKIVMESSVVSFSGGMPPGSDIAVTEVDAAQSSSVLLPGGNFNTMSVVALQNVALYASSSLLISNVNATRMGPGGGQGVYSTGTLTLENGSSLYVRYCRFAGYTYLFYVFTASVRDHSVVALLNSTMTLGTSLLYQFLTIEIQDSSVFRVVGNSGPVTNGIFLYDTWTVQGSSWLDWRDNDVGQGSLFWYSSFFSAVDIDGSSVLTLTGCKMSSTGLGGSL